jgi:cell division protein FtsL
MTSLAFAAPRPRARVPARRTAAIRASTFETRSFLAAAGAIACAFVLALAYLAGTTGVASVGYEAQRLQSQRDEVRRQNALLELELARLDSPTRIEAEAKRLGLVHFAFIPVVTAPAVARR